MNKPKKTFEDLGTRTYKLNEVLEWLEDYQVTDMFMESMGQYWVPVFNVFSEGKLKLILDNP